MENLPRVYSEEPSVEDLQAAELLLDDVGGWVGSRPFDAVFLSVEAAITLHKLPSGMPDSLRRAVGAALMARPENGSENGHAEEDGDG